MIRFFVSFLLVFTFLYAQNDENTEILDDYSSEPKVDCLILEDENSIICKYEALRSTQDQQIILQWIDPQGDISRSREMIVPAGHGSIYDYRYIKGRILGTWTFKVISENKEYSTEFELK